MMKITHPTIHTLAVPVKRLSAPHVRQDVRATMAKFANAHPPVEFRLLEIPTYTEADVKQFLLSGEIAK